MQVYFIEVNGYTIPTPYLTYEEANEALNEMLDRDRCASYRITFKYTYEL